MSTNHHSPYQDSVSVYKAADMTAPLGQLDAAISALSQIVVLDNDLTAPPGSPSDGDTYIPAATATGDWEGHEDDVTYWNGTEWIFVTPQSGWRCWVVDETLRYIFNGTSWVEDTPNPGSHTHTESDITDLDKYTQAQVDSALAGKSDTSHNHNLADLTEKNYSSLVSPPADDDMHSLTAETTIADTDEVLIWDASVSAYRRMTRANFLAGMAGAEQPYSIVGYLSGKPSDGWSVVFLFSVDVTFPAGLTDSHITAEEAAATAETVFSIKKNGVEVGTATFAASGSTATLAMASEQTFTKGTHKMTLAGPATADATLAGLAWSIKGTR